MQENRALSRKTGIQDTEFLFSCSISPDLISFMFSKKNKNTLFKATIQTDLASKNVEAQICEKGNRGATLTEEQKDRNREKSRVRTRVEHVFAQMTGSMKALRQRVIGFDRNAALIQLTNLVYNMLRFEQIKRLDIHYTRPSMA